MICPKCGSAQVKSNHKINKKFTEDSITVEAPVVFTTYCEGCEYFELLEKEKSRWWALCQHLVHTEKKKNEVEQREREQVQQEEED